MNDQQMLRQIAKTAQMGQVGIHAVMPYASQSALRQALKCQRAEYINIEQQALNLAKNRGFRPGRLSPAAKMMAQLSSKGRLISGDRNSKIAGMMVQGSTRGMIESLQNAGKWQGSDSAIAALAQKLLETEEQNLQQLKGFL